MWIPFFGRGGEGSKTGAAVSVDGSLPQDLKEFLEEEQPSITEREFKRNLKATGTASKLADAPKVEDLVQTGKSNDVLNNLNAFNQSKKQSTERLSQQELKEMTELDAYKRHYPVGEAVSENCSEALVAYFQCLDNGSFKDRTFGCLDKQNFHQACLAKQSVILNLFDYNSMDKVEQLDEIRGIADVVFNKYFKTYEDTNDESIGKLYGKELQHRREKFFEKHGK